MTFTKELKEQWVAALRSGEYKQGHGRLVREVQIAPALGESLPTIEVQHCCLGVLKEVAKMGVDPDSDIGYIRQNSRDMSPVYILLPGNTQKKLAGMNDDGKTFEEIANFIEHWVEAGTGDLVAGF